MPASHYIRKLREKIGHASILAPGVCAIIFDDEGRVLLNRSADDGKWHSIGGMIDPGEEPAHAAVREVKEETNLDVEVVRVSSVYAGPHVTYANGDEVSYLSIALVCRVVGDAEMRRADGEALELRWFAVDDMPANLKEHDRRAITQAARGEATWFQS